ncbi:tetratricopeptide repeat protein [Ferrimonas kyonanensis]|uniref:tetratricopeptide repeat protein n=1 Tax=Ferrimonas kyonanensis TaxID=364763 RepID=UPI0003F91679|nr:tetratricopeptide repeat protein [Ferrimonas kyonanensis]
MMRVTLLALCVALGGCAATDVRKDPEAQLTAAANYGGLIQLYKSQLSQQPDQPQLLLKLARSYYLNHDLESAQFYLSHLSDLGSDLPEQYLLQGKIHSDRQQYQAAYLNYQKAEQRGLTESELALRQGVALAQLKRFDEAERAFNLARLRGHDEVAVKNNLAMLQMQQGHYQQAVALLEPVYRAHPDVPQVQANLALSLVKNHQLEQARRLLASLYPQQPLAPLIQQLQQL